MRLTGICLISQDVSRLSAFYAQLFRVATTGDATFAQVQTEGASLSVFSEAGMERMVPGSLAHAGRGALTIEVEVDDVDAFLPRLQALNVRIVKPPTTQTWGRRSVWFQDPDGNLVNCYTPVPTA